MVVPSLDAPVFAVQTESLAAHDRVWLTGADAATFLNRLLTLDTRALPVGGGDRAFLLDARGRVAAGMRLFRLAEDRFVAHCAPGAGAALIEHLDRYHFGEDFEMTPATDTARCLFAAGADAAPRLAAVLADLGLPLPEGHGWAAGTLAGAPVLVTGSARTGLGAAVDLCFAPADAAVIDAAFAREPAGSAATLEQARVAAGVPEWPAEYGEHATPLDVHPHLGITDAKGCYPGQEVIERTVALGKPAQVLRGLWLSGPAQAGDPLEVAGAAAGRLTSVAALPDGRHAALALVKRRAAEADAPPTAVTAAGPIPATWRPLALEF